MERFTYQGQELALFRDAVNWKRYWSSILRPFVTGRVLDVGAGLGDNARYLHNSTVTAWCFLEPDERLLHHNQRQHDGEPGLASPSFFTGTIASLPAGKTFDTIIYIDVLEHILDDRQELERASRHLKAGGHLIVLSPAFPALFSDFDKSIGHYRRYTRQSLIDIAPRRLGLIKLHYIDAVGMVTSLANRFLLRSALPNPTLIRTWDRLLVPISRIVDPILPFRLGKSIYGVWTRSM
ncbi:MAG: class I SAM-dependent methyltransferase [Pseudomonadota bacterium]